MGGEGGCKARSPWCRTKNLKVITRDVSGQEVWWRFSADKLGAAVQRKHSYGPASLSARPDRPGSADTHIYMYPCVSIHTRKSMYVCIFAYL